MKIRVLLSISVLISVMSTQVHSTCDTQVNVRTGTNDPITSPNFPSSYPPNTKCTYRFYTSSGSDHITLTFSHFSLESHRACFFDYVEVYDGPTKSAKRLGRHCGTHLPPSYTSSGKYLTVFFNADTSEQYDGFEFSVTAGCLYQFTGLEGQFSSPSFPAQYPDNSKCTYDIAPTSGQQFLLTFAQFDVEESTDCIFDRLELSAPPSDVPFARVCGNRGSFKRLVNETHLVVRFITDASVSRSGFSLSYRMTTNCSADNGGCSHHCTDASPGVVVCSCDAGYQLDKNGVQCVDINECLSFPCSDVCTNYPGYFNCSCTTPGYQLSPDGLTCTDMTCTVNNGGCEHLCQPFGNAQYHCACHRGYVLSSDSHNCSDVDECTTTNPKYRHHCDQICINVGGSYSCECNEGYELSPNGRTCRDIDECPDQGHVCEHKCVNQEGNWTCGCYDGYEIDPNNSTTCIDIDECSRGIAPDTCATCYNIDGSYDCTCKGGYVPNEESTGCIDIDECRTNKGGCQQICLNTPGNYSCACISGYGATSNGSTDCQDINECAPNDGRGPCDHYCENLPGTFQCLCLSGYFLQQSGIMCEDIDECSDNNGGCQQQCNNVPGSFSCQCFDGYGNEGGSCLDVDECLSSPCDDSVNAACLNTLGSFQCTCPPGYVTENVTVCRDVDECALTNHSCSQICDNLPGGFQCQCRRGFTKQGETDCIDINECSQNPCHHVCINMIGSFECRCDSGHYLLADGYNCSDVDECADQISNCEHICVNNIGYYSCKCRPGFNLNADNFTCTDIDECSESISGCSHNCINSEGSFWCYCPTGFVVGADNRTCEDVDECASGNGGCDHACTNTNGSFTCGCNPGYEFDGRFSCSDIDECASNNGGCNQTCTNSEGSYECSCGPTFRLSSDNHTCEHCPSCEEFQRLVDDVSGAKQLATTVEHLRQSNLRLSADVASLQSRVTALEARLGSSSPSSSSTRGPK